MVIDLRKEVEMALKEAAKPVGTNFLGSLKASDYDYFFLKVTRTALAKNIFDANKEVRDLLKKLCIFSNLTPSLNFCICKIFPIQRI